MPLAIFQTSVLPANSDQHVVARRDDCLAHLLQGAASQIPAPPLWSQEESDLTTSTQYVASFATCASELVARRDAALSVFAEVARRCRPYDVASSQFNHPIVRSVGASLRPVTMLCIKVI